MKVRFYIDPDTQMPHVHNHGIDEEEVLDVLLNRSDEYVEDRVGREGTRVAIGQTTGGRYVRVIYVPEPTEQGVFVVTAYEIQGKPLTAFRRRRKRK